MAADKYRHAEEEYFRLRGQFDTGRLSQEDFDEKLRALMVQDEQGRYWMLGADSGKWYYYDGAKWVTGDPFPGAAAGDNSPTEILQGKPLAPTFSPQTQIASSPPAPRPIGSPRAPAATGSVSTRRSPFALILIIGALLLLAVGGYLIFQNRGGLAFIAQQATPITPVLPPTITRAPSPTFLAALPTESLPTLAPLPTAIPDTAVPDTGIPPTESVATETGIISPTLEATTVPTSGPTIIVVTSIPPTEINTPTLLPTVTNPAPPPSATPIPPTKAPVKPTSTPLPTTINAPPGVYVTVITLDPAAPLRNQSVTFHATFVNTTGAPVNYNWIIRTFDPAVKKADKGFGESDHSGITVAPGTTDFSITYVVVTGPGGCKSLYAQATNWLNKNERSPFPNTDGTPFTVYFDVCPSS